MAYWVSPWQLAQCPHCLYRFHPSDAHLRPTRGNGPLVNDEGVEWFLERRVSLPPAVDPTKDRSRWQRWLSRLRVVSQTAAGYDHLCPRCHLPISLASATGQIPTAALAIIGEKGAGKSTYLGMLIRQLLDGDHASIAGFSVTPQDSFDVNRMQRVSSRDLWQCRYADVMFEQRRLLEGTPSAAVNPIYRTPLILRLRQLFGWHRQLELCLYDTAGEDLSDDRLADRYYPFLPKMQGVLLLIDPLRLPQQRDKLTPHERQALGLSQASAILERLQRLMERYGRYPVGKPIHLPMAIVLTKSDRLRDDPPPARFLEPSRHVGGIDLADLQVVSQEVQDRLRRYGGANMLAQLQRFSTVGYFAVSSLGKQPSPEAGGYGSFLDYTPLRVVDPLFWLLHRLGFLPASRATPAA